MPNTLPPIDSPEYISFVKRAGDKTPVHVHPIGAVTKNQDGKQITEMNLMYNEGAVAFSDDGLPIQNGDNNANCFRIFKVFKCSGY